MADLRIGSTDIADVRIGSTQVRELRLGSALIWSSAPVTPPPPVARDWTVRTTIHLVNGSRNYRRRRLAFNQPAGGSLEPDVTTIESINFSGFGSFVSLSSITFNTAPPADVGNITFFHRTATEDLTVTLRRSGPTTQIWTVVGSGGNISTADLWDNDTGVSVTLTANAVANPWI